MSTTHWDQNNKIFIPQFVTLPNLIIGYTAEDLFLPSVIKFY